MNAPVESANPYRRLPLEGEGPVDLQRQHDVVARLRMVLPAHCVLYREEGAPRRAGVCRALDYLGPCVLNEW